MQGDDGAVAEVIENCRPGLQLYLYALTGDMPLAEDVTQDTFIKLFVRRPRYRRDAAFKTWLYTIGRNLAYTALRRRRREEPCALPPEDTDAREGPEALFFKEEQKRRLHGAMDKLPPSYRQILWLTYFEGLSGRDAAQIMGITVHNADVLRSRAKAALKKQLLKEGIMDEIE